MKVLLSVRMEDGISIDMKALHTKRFSSLEKCFHTLQSDLLTCKAARWMSGGSSLAQL